MKKSFRMAVGCCGPTILYTNIIKAENAEEAARIYLGDEAGNEAELEKITRRMHEVEGPKKRAEDEPMVDALGVPLEVGVTVAVVLPPKKTIVKGTVKTIKRSTIILTLEDGSTKTFRTDADDGVTIKMIVKIDQLLIAAEPELPTDALGQEIKVGCKCAYKIPYGAFSSKEIGSAVVEKIAGDNVIILDAESNNTVRKTMKHIVMLEQEKSGT